MYKKFFILGFIIFFFPFISLAALNAGVVNGVWFSNPTPKSGETIKIFTAVQNQSKETLHGTVAFLVNSKIIGSTTFSVESNDVIPVSISHLFLGGEYKVRAYITSVKGTNVVYTIVPGTTLVVTPSKVEKVSKSTNTDSYIKKAEQILSSTFPKATNFAKNTTNRTLNSIDPIFESLAKKVDTIHNVLIASSTNPILSTDTSTTRDDSSFITPKKNEVSTFVRTSKNTLTAKGLATWKKATAILLGLVSLALRMWFVFVVVFFFYIFWRLVRGRRIR